MVRIKSFPKRILPAIKRGMTVAMPLITGKIVNERLKGQGPFPVSDHKLGVKSGRLYRSVRWTLPEISGQTVLGSIGTNVKYAGAHEFGFSGSVQVRAHSRKSFSHRSFLGGTTKSGKQKTVRKKVRGADIQVRTHTRKLNIPERAPIRTGISDHKAILGEEITKAVIEEATKK
jgi:phage gpG-like protein